MATPDEATPEPTLTPAAVLAAIAAAGDTPWFASRYAAETGTDRDALDEPLGRLRLAGLVRVATWVRGLGQGYVPTPEGEAAAATGVGIPGLDAKPAPAEARPNAADLAPVEPEPAERPSHRLGIDPRPPVLVPLLLIANVLWFFAGLVAAIRGGDPVARYLGDGNVHLLHQFGAVTGTDLLNGEGWRLLSCCFVHIGLVHLLANMLAVAMVGPLAELLWGRWRLAAIYAVAGLAGSCLAMAHQPDALLAGASGAIWGVLASLVAWLLLFRQYLPREVAADWARRLWIVFLLNGAVSFLPGISWEAHLGGGVAGFVAAGLLNALRFGSLGRRLAALLLLAALPLACVGGLIAAMTWSPDWVALRQRIADAEARAVQRAEAEAELNRLTAAQQEYNRDVAPRLFRLTPESVRAAENPIWHLLFRPGERRNPEAVAAARAKATELKTTADELAAHTSRPTGVESLDRQRGQIRAYAEARSRSFALLLPMLDSPAVPDTAAWGEARRAADAAWAQLMQPAKP